MINDVAIVGYLRGEVARYIAGMVQAHAPSVMVRRPHLTFLPGRPPALADPEIVRRLRGLVPAHLPLEVELGGVRNFLPVSPVVYLDVVAGTGALEQFRRALLQATENPHPERFPFHPHLTLAYNLPPEEILRLQPRLQAAWAEYPGERRLRFTEVTLVRQTGPANWLDLGAMGAPEGE